MHRRTLDRLTAFPYLPRTVADTRRPQAHATVKF